MFLPPQGHHQAYQYRKLLLLLLLLLLFTAIELSHGGSSPYSNTDEANKNKYI
jgi:hypothetical protein